MKVDRSTLESAIKKDSTDNTQLLSGMDLDTLNSLLSLLYPVLIIFVVAGTIYFLYYLAKAAVDRKIRDEIERKRDNSRRGS